MIPKILFILVAVLYHGVSSAPQTYEALGVEHRASGGNVDVSRAITATEEILPEITSTFQKISSGDPSDPAFTQNLVSAFMPLARKILFSRANSEGREVSQDELKRIDAAEAVMPSVTRFIERMRDININTEGWQNPTSYGSPAVQSVWQPTGNLQPDTGNNANFKAMASATMELLPEINNVFEQIGNNQGNPEANNPQLVQNVIMGFMPLARKALVATAKAEGRPVKPDELARLDAAEAIMPSVFEFMNRIPNTDSFGSQSTSSWRTGSFQSDQNEGLKNLPSAFAPFNPKLTSSYPAPIAEPIQVQSAFEETKPVEYSEPVFPKPVFPKPSVSSSLATASNVFPASTFLLQSPQVYNTVPVKSPAFPSVIPYPSQQVYSPFFPVVPSAGQGQTIYTYGTRFN